MRSKADKIEDRLLFRAGSRWVDQREIDIARWPLRKETTNFLLDNIDIFQLGVGGVFSQVCDGGRKFFNGDNFLEPASKRQRKQADAGIKIESRFAGEA